VTRLDRIGLPVWQAVRPMSQALSVHQGKGATPQDAQVGALLEAVERHAAESFACEGPICGFEQLALEKRAPFLADFAADRERAPAGDEEVAWVESKSLSGDAPLYLPFDLVSLDFTRNVPSLFDRASNGVAIGATREEAIVVALHELIERDSVTVWKAQDLFGIMESTVEPKSVPFDWFHFWRGKIEAAGARMRCYAIPSLTGSPVFACEINDLSKDGNAYRAVQGRGCHFSPEVALFKAVAEAIQGRATYIAGARDDLLPSDYVAPETAITIAFGFPLPPSMEGLDLSSVAPGPSSSVALAAALERVGYGRIGIVELASPAGLHVVRAFVCGLASLTRRRRPPT
jgi:ribosomal protein S12 methylthiotransferase accessory factor